MSSYQRGILTEGETMAEVVEKTPSARSLPLGLVRVLATPQVKRSEIIVNFGNRKCSKRDCAATGSSMLTRRLSPTVAVISCRKRARTCPFDPSLNDYVAMMYQSM